MSVTAAQQFRNDEPVIFPDAFDDECVIWGYGLFGGDIHRNAVFFCTELNLAVRAMNLQLSCCAFQTVKFPLVRDELARGLRIFGGFRSKDNQKGDD